MISIRCPKTETAQQQQQQQQQFIDTRAFRIFAVDNFLNDALNRSFVGFVFYSAIKKTLDKKKTGPTRFQPSRTQKSPKIATTSRSQPFQTQKNRIFSVQPGKNPVLSIRNLVRTP